jgi:hypothetical protein
MISFLALGLLLSQSAKKGIGTYPGIVGGDVVERLNASWYYNWSDKPDAKPHRRAEFVPMIWNWSANSGSEKKEAVARLKDTGAKFVLGFNEPDGKEQANMTVDQALDAWPVLMKSGLPLGSPAAINADKEWLQTFMSGAKKRSYPVDFVTVHWYYLPNPDDFLAYIKKVHDLYGLPIWITEFACVDWDHLNDGKPRFTSSDVVRFVSKVLPALDKLDYVKRYAWFIGDGPYQVSNLFKKDGSLTEIGKVYASH